jgi:PKD repeat protein
MFKFLHILAILFFSISYALIAQPVANFDVDPVTCKNQSIELENLSQDLTDFTWDFCHNDLLANPLTDQPFELTTTGTFFYSGIRIIQDGGNWYGFVTDLNGQKLWRINFGSSLSGQPESITDLGNLQGALTSPGPIELVKENGVWYGFIANVFSNNLARIKFNNGITEIPDVEQNFITGSTPIGIKVIDTDVDKKLIVTFLSSARLSVFDLGTSFDGNIIETNHINNSNFGWGVDVVKVDVNWIALVVGGNGDKVFKVDFGASLLNSSPEITEIASVSSANEIKIVKEGQNFVSFIRSSNNGISRANLGSTIGNTANYVKISNNDLANNSRSLEVVREFPGYSLYTIEAQGGKMFKLNFEGDCSDNISINSSTDTTPVGVKYFAQGNYWIELMGEDINHDIYLEGKSILINDSNVPELSIIISSNVCLGNSNTFSIDANKTIVAANWNFGDGNNSSLNTVNHQYNTTGAFQVALQVTDDEGCKNVANSTHSIFNAPVADFILPTGLICTNNQFSFVNSTSDNFEGNLSFQWLLDDTPVSTDVDLVYTFTSGGDKELTLQASIPGCTSESVQVLTGIGEGPTVDFTAEGICLNESIQFNNNSQGDIASYAWNFGDGQTSIETTPSVSYETAGNYTIELEALGTNGCLSAKSLVHQVFSTPQPDFNTDLPPFSCNGSATQFNDLTLPLIDSNINAWLWDFDDQNLNASEQHPQHTYAVSGDYNVSLTVTSDQGCVATLNKIITIAQSPLPIITNTAACVETAVILQDGSTIPANDWQWQIGNNFYFTETPSHVFSTPGDYQASLTLTASNGCMGTSTKQINVPEPLAVDFESAFNCVNTPTQFTSLVKDDSDPVLIYTWTFSEEQRNGSSVNFLYSQPGIQEIQLTASTTSGCSYTITKAVNILPEPKADFSFTPLSGPPPLAVTFTNLSTDATSFAWRFNDSDNTTSNLNNPAFTFTEVGQYAVDLTAYNAVGCESTVSKLIDIAFPFLNVTLDNFRIIENTDGSFLLLTNIVNNGNVLVQNPRIEIRLDNAAILQEVVNNSIDPGDAIDYTFATQVSNVNNLSYACVRLLLPNNEALEDTEACITFNTSTALTSPYPNPANNSVTVEWISPADEQVLIAVTDNLGNGIATESISAKQGLNTIVLQTMDWQAGIYYIRLKSASKAHYFRTIIAR